jgi:hypothetical protein
VPIQCAALSVPSGGPEWPLGAGAIEGWRRPLRPARACLRRRLPPLRCAAGCPVTMRAWIGGDARAAAAHVDLSLCAVVGQQSSQEGLEAGQGSLAGEGDQLAELDTRSERATGAARRSRAGRLWDARSLRLLGSHGLAPIALGGDSSDTWSGARPAFGRAIVERGGGITETCLRYLTTAARRSRCQKTCCAAAHSEALPICTNAQMRTTNHPV